MITYGTAVSTVGSTNSGQWNIAGSQARHLSAGVR